jgi:N utilization substance protein A
MLEIEEFDEQMVDDLRGRARDALLIKAIASEEKLETTAEPAQDLLDMPGIDPDLAQKMAKHGICTVDDLAEQSVDELMEVDGMDEERAASLIMKARESWFAEG